MRSKNTLTWNSLGGYAVRFLACFMTMEFVLHYMYMVAIKDTKAWGGFSAAELSLVGFWNLIIVWLKVGGQVLMYFRQMTNPLISCYYHGGSFVYGLSRMVLIHQKIWSGAWPTIIQPSAFGRAGTEATISGLSGNYPFELQVSRSVSVPTGTSTFHSEGRGTFSSRASSSSLLSPSGMTCHSSFSRGGG